MQALVIVSLAPFWLNVPVCDVLHIFNNLPPFQCGKYHTCETEDQSIP